MYAILSIDAVSDCQNSRPSRSAAKEIGRLLEPTAETECYPGGRRVFIRSGGSRRRSENATLGSSAARPSSTASSTATVSRGA